MPVKTTTTTTVRTTQSGVAVHTISFRGLAGAIFVCLALATVLYVIGFATTDWTITDNEANADANIHKGLWASCVMQDATETADWFKAFQVMISLGLVGLFLCIILAIIYLCVHTVSKNASLLALVIFCFLTVIFMLVGFIVLGAHTEDTVHWSFAISVVASVFCLVAGILAIVQMRKSGVRV